MVTSFRYVIWGAAGYMGSEDCNDDGLRPIGVTDASEAKRVSKAMIAICERYVDEQAEIISSSEEFEWDGSELWYVAAVALPANVAWLPGNRDPFQALKAHLASRTEDQLDTFLSRCKAGVSGGGRDGDGSVEYDDAPDRAMGYFADELR